MRYRAASQSAGTLRHLLPRPRAPGLDAQVGHGLTKIGTPWGVNREARFELFDRLLEEYAAAPAGAWTTLTPQERNVTPDRYRHRLGVRRGGMCNSRRVRAVITGGGAVMTEARVLHRPMYSEAEAARLLRVPQSTLHWWLDGGTIGGRTYPPVIREEPTGSREVTWGEFVEAGLLRQYRRELLVALAELRAFIDEMRTRFEDPYPLAARRPYVGEGPRLVQESQDATNLDGRLRLVTSIGGQFVWLPPADSFIQRVQWRDDIVGSWRPHDDPASPVRMDPDRRFGRPAVGGVSTVVLWEQIAGGADFAETAELFNLSVDDVEWAWAYERSVRDPRSQAA